MDGKNVTGRQTRRTENRGGSKLRCKDDGEMDLRYVGLKKMENKSCGQSRMCICREGSEGRIYRALVVKTKKKEKERKRRRSRRRRGRIMRRRRRRRRRGEGGEKKEEEKKKEEEEEEEEEAATGTRYSCESKDKEGGTYEK